MSSPAAQSQGLSDLCATDEPAMRLFGPGHTAACHFPLREPAAAPE
jgi:hypothetical protein